MTIRNLDALLEPTSVVVIGASDRPGSIGRTVLTNIVCSGFGGRIDLVNPRHAEIQGRRCYGLVEELPEAPALAVVATPPATIPEVIAQLAAKGTRAAVVLTAGLDADVKQKMLDAGRPAVLRILGPNCIGLMLPHLKLNATFAHRAARPGGLAFVSQSGALVTAVVDWANHRGIGFSHVVSLGDMADVDFGDMLDYLAGDARSDAILLYMETVTHAPKFMSAARRAARSKPVIVIKSGRHAAAAQAAQSHTGRLSGSDAAYEAAFRRAGLVRVLDLHELFEAAELLARSVRIGGERLTILTNGGGAGVLAADRLADFDGQLAALSEPTRAALDGVLPPTWSHANPIDIVGDATIERYGRAFDIVLEDPATDAILVINCPTALTSSLGVAETLLTRLDARRARPGRQIPVLTNWLGAETAAASRNLFEAAGIPTFDTPGAAARGYMHMVHYARGQTALMRTPTASALDVAVAGAAVRTIIERATAEGRATLTEVESKEIVKAAGIAVVPQRIATTPEAAAGAAGELLAEHHAVALKILSVDISHKSDVGGVQLDLTSVEAVQVAAVAMLARVAKARPQARIAGFTVAPMIRRPHAHELIVGMSVDATFGPTILFGAGGTAVEVMKDTALALPPLDLDLARDTIRETRVARLLAGYRDRPPADLDAIARALVAISTLVAEYPEIRELDINPLLADETGVLALDARARIATAAEAPRVAMAIRPYPTRWSRRVLLDGIGGIDLRPIKPEDEALYNDFMSDVSPDDHRLRFFQSKTGLSHRFVARLTQIDYARDMAFAAIGIGDGRLLGVSRFAADPDHVRGEYAVLVRSALKGRGLGWHLMQQLIDYARAEGLGEIYGSVLPENETMLKMCRELGFRIETDPADPCLRMVTLPLVGS